uniref:IF rod domain-containing protein n=1 Tax=Maylandia zebra TaxID=106582 RepID=A0A3P9C7L4_9CICH
VADQQCTPKDMKFAVIAASYSQKSLQVSSASRARVQSPSPSRCRGASYDSRGRSGYHGTAIEVGTEIHQHHANEKEEMQELNVKFAGYIQKVQALEQRNASLQAELTALQSRYKGGPTGIGEEYELKFKEVRELIEVVKLFHSLSANFPVHITGVSSCFNEHGSGHNKIYPWVKEGWEAAMGTLCKEVTATCQALAEKSYL